MQTRRKRGTKGAREQVQRGRAAMDRTRDAKHTCKASTRTNNAHRLTLIKRRDNRKTKELIDEQTEVTSIVSTNRMMIMNSERRVKGASRATRIELKL